MLGGSIEYFGALNMWVAPPDTDELAEQGIHTWQRIHPDVQMVALSQHRFQEVAAKMGLDLVAGLRLPRLLHGRVRAGPAAADDRRVRVLRLPRRARPHLRRGPPARGLGRHPGHRPRHRAPTCPPGQWGNLVVTTLDRDNGLLRYDLEEAAMIEGPADCPQGETSRMGFWGGRFKDLLSSQGVHFQVSDLEQAVAIGGRADHPDPRVRGGQPAGLDRAAGGAGRGRRRPGRRSTTAAAAELGGQVRRRGATRPWASRPRSRCSTARRCPAPATSSSAWSTSRDGTTDGWDGSTAGRPS